MLKENLDKSIEFVKALREMVRFERPDYVSPMRPDCPFETKSTVGAVS
jgi:hypothetical protein